MNQNWHYFTGQAREDHEREVAELQRFAVVNERPSRRARLAGLLLDLAVATGGEEIRRSAREKFGAAG
jgi:hypothetical protein